MNRYLLRRIAFVLLAANFLVPMVVGRAGWTAGDATTDGPLPAQVVGPADDGRGAIAVVVPTPTIDRQDADPTGTATTGAATSTGSVPLILASAGPLAAAPATSSPADTASSANDRETAADASPTPSRPAHAGAHKDNRDTADRDQKIGRGRSAQPAGLTRPRPSVPPGHAHP